MPSNLRGPDHGLDDFGIHVHLIEGASEPVPVALERCVVVTEIRCLVNWQPEHCGEMLTQHLTILLQ